MPTAAEVDDWEERLRNLAALCEGIRAACACGTAKGLTLADLEPFATLAAQMSADLIADPAHRSPVRPPEAEDR